MTPDADVVSTARAELAGIVSTRSLDSAGHRTVAPYNYTHKCHSKQRWVGKRILDVFVAEFGSHEPSYFSAAISAGAITVNGHLVDASYELRNNDFVEHRMHRHEPPITGEPTRVLVNEADDSGGASVDAGVVAVSKPGGMPVHPGGPFRYLSLTSVLAASDGVTGTTVPLPFPLFIVHRLDRLTSGVVLLATSREAARRVCDALLHKAAASVRKEYLAIVAGRFPVNAVPMSATAAAAGLGEETMARLQRDLPTLWRSSVCTPADTAVKRSVDSTTAPHPPRTSAAHPSAGAVAVDGEAFVAAFRPPGGLRKWAQDLGGDRVDDAQDIGSGCASSAADGDAPRVDFTLEWVQADGDNSSTTGGRWLSLTTAVGSTDVRNGLHGVLAASGPLRDGAEDKSERPSVTRFMRLAYDEARNVSLVIVRPVSGRTHQIRVHAAWLGFPIDDDPLYGLPSVSPQPAVPIGACANTYDLHVSPHRLTPARTVVIDAMAKSAPTANEEVAAQSGCTDIDAVLRSLCVSCTRGPAVEFTANQLRAEGIHLHAWHYSGPGWAYTAPPPAWATGFSFLETK